MKIQFLWGNTFLFCSPPATPSSPSQTLEGLFELTRRPSRALDSPRALLLSDRYTVLFKSLWLTLCVASGTKEIQRHGQVCGAGRGGPRTPLRTHANHFYVLVTNSNTSFHSNKNWEGGWAPLAHLCNPLDEGNLESEHANKTPVSNRILQPYGCGPGG